jgi:hypothetical protein
MRAIRRVIPTKGEHALRRLQKVGKASYRIYMHLDNDFFIGIGFGNQGEEVRAVQ